jgi:hypothetical protein
MVDNKGNLDKSISNELLNKVAELCKKAEPITFEDWNNTLIEKYKNLFKTVNKLIPEIWTPLEFALSVKTILNIKNCTLPFAGIILGAPSSLKSQVIELFNKWKNSYYTDGFTPKALVSHYAGIKEEELKKIDMLPQITNKLFLVSELSGMFSKKEDETNEIIGILTRVLDGRGLMTNTGACGQRGYNEDMMFTWLGAGVDIPYRVHKLMGTRGAKLHFFRIPRTKKSEEQQIDSMDNDDFNIKLAEIRASLLDYLKWFDDCPISELVSEENDLIKIQWNNDKTDRYTKRVLVRLGNLLAHLRAVVNTWDTYGSQGLEYNYSTATIEQPDRAITQLRNLSRGHALMQGRNWIIIEDLPIAIKVVLSTASLDRVNIFDLLIAHKGKLTTKIITESLNVTPPTARRIMAELKAVELVVIKEPNTETEEKEIILKKEFDWFLTDEFQELRQGFEPTDYSEHIKEYCKKYDINLKENSGVCNKPLEETYLYECYECKRANHDVYQTNSQKEYEKHWISSGHRGTCYPNIADLKLHGREPQGKEWEI